MADDPESRQDHNIHFRMTEEPEQMQEQDRVTAPFRNEERGTEIPVCQQHRDRPCQYRHSQQQ